MKVIESFGSIFPKACLNTVCSSVPCVASSSAFAVVEELPELDAVVEYREREAGMAFEGGDSEDAVTPRRKRSWTLYDAEREGLGVRRLRSGGGRPVLRKSREGSIA